MSVQPGDILHVVIEASLGDGTIVQNRHRFKLDAPVPHSDAAILIAVKNYVETLYGFVASQIKTAVELEQGTVDVIAWDGVSSSWEVVQNVGIYSPLDTFANTNDVLPNQCAPFVIGNTSRPKSKGRCFLFPFSEDQQNHGVLESAALTAIGLFAAQYIASQAIAGDELDSGIVREAVNQWYQFTTASYGDVIGTQRRRRKGIGM